MFLGVTYSLAPSAANKKVIRILEYMFTKNRHKFYELESIRDEITTTDATPAHTYHRPPNNLFIRRVKVFLCGGAASNELGKFRIDLARQSRKIVTKPPPPTSPPKRVDVIHVRVCRTPKKR
jgi:hypothetical protein